MSSMEVSYRGEPLREKGKLCGFDVVVCSFAVLILLCGIMGDVEFWKS